MVKLGPNMTLCVHICKSLTFDWLPTNDPWKIGASFLRWQIAGADRQRSGGRRLKEGANGQKPSVFQLSRFSVEAEKARMASLCARCWPVRSRGVTPHLALGRIWEKKCRRHQVWWQASRYNMGQSLPVASHRLSFGYKIQKSGWVFVSEVARRHFTRWRRHQKSSYSDLNLLHDFK